MTFAVTAAPAQTVAKIDFKSVGRAWPLAADLNTYHMTGATLRGMGHPSGRPLDRKGDPGTAWGVTATTSSRGARSRRAPGSYGARAIDGTPTRAPGRAIAR